MGPPRRLLVAGTVAFDHVALAPKLATPNTTVLLREHRQSAGGAAGNVAMALARLGDPPTLLSSVGPDFAGSAYERNLLDAGVDLGPLARVPEPTARAFVFSRPDGDQAIYFHAGASDRMDACEPVPARLGHFSAGDIAHYPRLMEACETVTFDPGQEVFHRHLADVRACIPHVDHLFLNEHELATLRDAWGWTLRDFLDAGPRTLVVSRGALGLRVHARDEPTMDVPAVPTKPEETTGAGDGHRAGFLLALSHGATVPDAVRVGAVVASFVIERIGPQQGLPSRAACRERYERHYGEWPL